MLVSVTDQQDKQEDKCGWGQSREPLQAEGCGEGVPRGLYSIAQRVTLALPVWHPVGLHMALILAGVPSFTLP